MLKHEISAILFCRVLKKAMEQVQKISKRPNHVIKSKMHSKISLMVSQMQW